MSELVVRISADIKKLEDGYKQAEKQTEALSEKLGEIAKVSGVAFAAQTAGIGLMVSSYQKVLAEDNKLKAALLTTGGAAGQSFESLKAMGDELELLTGIQGEVINSSQTLLLTFNKINGEAFPQALKAAADLSVLMGTDLKSATLQVGKALQDPIEGLASLSRVGIRFNEEQKKQIEAFTRSGQIAQAQTLILKSLEERVGGLAQKSQEGNEGINKFKKTIGDVGEEIGAKFLPVINKAAGLLGSFFEMVSKNEVLIGIAARLLTIGTLLTGLASAGALGALGIVKVQTAISALNLTFGAARVQAALFWGAATLGVATLITFLPEIIRLVKSFGTSFEEASKGKGLKEINEELEKMRQKKELILKQPPLFQDKTDLAVLEKKIAVLEKVKKAKEEAEAPAKKQEQTAGGEDAQLDLQTQKRLKAAQNETALLRAERSGASQEELEFLRRKQELILEEEEANREQIASIRAQKLEANRLEKEQLLIDEQEYYDKRAELVLEAREKQAVLDEELRTLDLEQRKVLEDEDLEALRNKVMTENDVERQLASQKVANQIDINNRRLLEAKKYGKAYAEINAFMHREEVIGAAAAADQLVALSQSKNNTLKGIGKAAALTQIAISTAQGAISAYASLAPIPFVGPALGIAAAAALTAFGFERASQVMAAADGGLLTGGTPGKDSIPVLGMPGELVVPTRNFEEVVGAVRAQRNGESSMGEGSMGILREISQKLDNIGNVIIQGDFYGDETFIDKIGNDLFKAKQTRNLQY